MHRSSSTIFGPSKMIGCPSPAGYRSQLLGQSPTGCSNPSAVCLGMQTAL